jgi:hypothetical protein
MSQPGSAIQVLADNKGTVVPGPNTTGATFIEFPSSPRIDATSGMVATRGQSQPVYTLPDGTKVGTSGVYVTPSGGPLVTGASLLGDAGFTQFQVPNAPAGTGFDQFPGAPSATDGSVVAFKGNYTVAGAGLTGVFFRDAAAAGGSAPVTAIAQAGDLIPNGGGATFGATATPSAAQGKVVFTGWNNETAPTVGGIYEASLTAHPTITPLVGIGSAVPGVPGASFTNFGESISFTGTKLGFWGTWGSETKTVHMNCPTDGNAGVVAYCLSLYPNGTDLVEPVHQGIFSLDATTGQLDMIAQTGQDGFTDFMSWNFSGAVPGTTTDAEPARWRSSSFVAEAGGNVSFLGEKSTVDGLYFTYGAGAPVETLLDTTYSGQSVDPLAPVGSLVSSIGLERDGYRGGLLAITVGMLNPVTTDSWSGIYLAYVDEPSALLLLGGLLPVIALMPNRRRQRV